MNLSPAVLKAIGPPEMPPPLIWAARTLRALRVERKSVAKRAQELDIQILNLQDLYKYRDEDTIRFLQSLEGEL